MRKALVVLFILLGGAAITSSYAATHHLIRVREFFPGTVLEPNAQYVELQMAQTDQNIVAGFSLAVLDSDGNIVGQFTFPINLPNSSNQTSMLIATPEAEAMFGITADVTMTPILDPESGIMCFAGVIDCVSWGAYAGAFNGGSGTPFRTPDSLELGSAVRRDISAGNPTMLEIADDTDDSDADFDYAFPTPRNNAGQVGVPPASTCGNGIIEGLEQCDDGNTNDGDGCDALCQTELPVCGNGFVEFGEECDDGNTSNGDGCDQVCQIEPLCTIVFTGDVDITGTLTSTDIISLVNYVFKSGLEPLPCEAAGDVNCDGAVTSTDIIFMVNHVFKSGPVPCDVCTLYPETWNCS